MRIASCFVILTWRGLDRLERGVCHTTRRKFTSASIIGDTIRYPYQPGACLTRLLPSLLALLIRQEQLVPQAQAGVNRSTSHLLIPVEWVGPWVLLELFVRVNQLLHPLYDLRVGLGPSLGSFVRSCILAARTLTVSVAAALGFISQVIPFQPRDPYFEEVC